ncbi:MAG TPA: hypothetical protein VKU40_04750, partial [Thermoanaerobaculia bacterium]|nr:hypothetical protein [Thermoanaerobaculia bacterium]
SVSNDGGRSFEVLVPFNNAHPDHHAMWIDPRDPEHVWLGNDGGVYESRDRGESWRFAHNLPLAQLYHVRLGERQPYEIYFGLQDNGSWVGPSTVWENGGIRNHHWQEVHFGDGFDTAPVPGDERHGYATSQEGYLVRWDRETGERKSIRPATGPDEETLRFNWNPALAVDPFDPDTVYFGSQYVHRSRDRGDSWETISPDLTSDNPEWQRQAESGGLTLDVTGAENFTALVTLVPSPHEEGVLWAGSDDGRLHLTRDGGETWTRLDGNVPGVPADTWIANLSVSPHDPATAFVVFDDHRRSNWTPYVYESRDYGATWRRLAGEDDVSGYALAILQDPVDPALLYLGTEFGLWFSTDRGGSWHPWRHGVPTVSAMDLAFQVREDDLVVGTHGRGVYVLDHVAPLRGLTAATLAEPLHLFAPTPAQQHRVQQSGSTRFPGQGEFRADTLPYGAAIVFSLAADDLPHPDEMKERERKQAEREAKRRAGEEAMAEGEGEAMEGEEADDDDEDAEPAGDGDDGPKAELEIRDGDGEVIRTFERPVHRGVNRVTWDLDQDAYDEPDPGDLPRWWEPTGPEVMPGEYTVTVRFRDEEATAPLTVVADPRYDLPEADRRAKLELLERVGTVQEALTAAIERVQQARGEVETALDLHARRQEESGEEGDDGEPDPLTEAGRELVSDLEALETTLWHPPDEQGIPKDDRPWDDLERAWMAESNWDAPTAAERRYLAIAEQAIAAGIEEVNAFFADRVAPFRQQVRDAELVLLPETEPLEMP